MKHPVLFRICLILLLFGIASVQALKDGEYCEGENSDGVHCHKHEKKLNPEYDDLETRKSVFSESHDCNNAGESDIGEGSCLNKDPVEDEDQSELSMLVEHARKDEVVESCEENISNCPEIISEEGKEEIVDQAEKSSSEVVESDLKGQETSDEEGDSNETGPSLNAQVESLEEVDKMDQDPENENVPLREILLKLKIYIGKVAENLAAAHPKHPPEGLTDNEDDQPSDFSVTEASMGEDSEVEEETLVSSGSADKQDPGVDNSSTDGSKNGSGSGSGINKKAVCSEVNTTDLITDVEIINATMLMKLLQGNPNVTNRSSSGPCHIIYFFSPYCPFSVAGSPYVNAMARSLRNIPVYGLDSIEHHSVNARYGVMGTPTLLLFHNGNGVGRYNASEFSVMQLLAFINHYTDQTITDINVTSSDFRATLPAQIAEGRPYALWASWIFLLSCAAWLFLTSELCARLTEAILNNWREAEAQNDQD